MRIGILHSRYRGESPSGENIAVRQQVAALEQSGYQVVEFIRDSDDIASSLPGKIASASKVALGQDRQLARELVASKIDLLHVHNTFPNFGVRAILEFDGPVVFTVHNYRTVCANGLLFRDGHDCVDCLDQPLSGLRHACYRDSRFLTSPIVFGNLTGAGSRQLLSRSERVVVQSIDAQQFFADIGVAANRMSFIPGFTERVHEEAVEAPRDERYIFVGRDSPEKGLRELLDIWPTGVPLDIVGSLGANTRLSNVNKSIEYLGIRDRTWIQEHLPAYTALIFPGLVREGAYPIVIREAVEAGIPVVALEGSAASSLVIAYGIGATYAPRLTSSLNLALSAVKEAGLPLRRKCRIFFQNHLTQETWSHKIARVYSEAIAEHAK